MRIIVSIGFSLFIIGFLTAQNTYQKTYWTRIFVRLKINDKWSWQTEVDNRRIFSPQPDHALQFIAHTHLHRRLGQDREGALGFTYSVVWQGHLPVPELRPFQEFYIFQKLGDKTHLSHRFRTEQRWFHNYTKEELTAGYHFKFRGRYMLRLERDLGDKWLLKTNSETLFHHNAFDQERLYLGTEFKFSKRTSIELAYLKLWQLKNTGLGYFDRDNMRLTVYQNFNLPKNTVQRTPSKAGGS
jgi:hypothetical protein